MTIEVNPPTTKKNPLQTALLEIAARIDVPRNKWENAWIDVAQTAGNTLEEIEVAAAKKRPKVINPQS